jgi:hypothetical protein
VGGIVITLTSLLANRQRRRRSLHDAVACAVLSALISQTYRI